jgi:hypothetical protein
VHQLSFGLMIRLRPERATGKKLPPISKVEDDRRGFCAEDQSTSQTLKKGISWDTLGYQREKISVHRYSMKNNVLYLISCSSLRQTWISRRKYTKAEYPSNFSDREIDEYSAGYLPSDHAKDMKFDEYLPGTWLLEIVRCFRKCGCKMNRRWHFLKIWRPADSENIKCKHFRAFHILEFVERRNTWTSLAVSRYFGMLLCRNVWEQWIDPGSSPALENFERLPDRRCERNSVSVFEKRFRLNIRWSSDKKIAFKLSCRYYLISSGLARNEYFVTGADLNRKSVGFPSECDRFRCSSSPFHLCSHRQAIRKEPLVSWANSEPWINREFGGVHSLPKSQYRFPSIWLRSLNIYWWIAVIPSI